MSHASDEMESETMSRDSNILAEKILHKTHLEAKLNEYKKECFRYNEKTIKLIEQCIEEEIKICNLRDYIIGTLQCKLMFDTFAMFPSTRLTSMCLQNNHLDGFCCDSIVRFLQSSVTLQELNLEGCRIGDEGTNILIDGLENSVSLKKLNLSNNCISDNVGGDLVTFLYNNNTCQDLNLSSNQLSFRTSKSLRVVLSQNDTIKRLDISHNRLYEQFAIVEILTGLRENESLEYLDISWNGLYGEPFGHILSKSIKSSKLKVFKLEHNELTTFEYTKLAVGMKYSKTIEECYIGGNPFEDEDDEILINVFTTKSPLRLLSLGNFFYISQATHQVNILFI
jgi:Ran GTPase-activating protein (RanGAP) involved in mRNA processing and transport